MRTNIKTAGRDMPSPSGRAAIESLPVSPAQSKIPLQPDPPNFRPLFRLADGLSLVLASASPRRRSFLEEWGLPFVIARPGGAEPAPLPGEPPVAYAGRAAQAKAHATLSSLEPETRCRSLIVAADTVVALGESILGKPRDTADAIAMLQRLAGRGHEVITAVCLLLPQSTSRHTEEIFSDTSRVFFHPWPLPLLTAYAATGEPTDKAGAYAIQGQGAFLVERLEGSWSTVVGLPVTLLAARLLEYGCIFPVD